MKTFCICLPEQLDQIANAKKHFEDVGLENVEFFWGIHADTAGLATWHTYERDNPGSGFKMGARPTGIWISHYMLWNTIAHSETSEHVMVVEADARFLEGWKEILQVAINAIPKNFDFLYPGHCCVEGWNDHTEVIPGVWETKHIQCSHCYVLRRPVVPFLLKTLRKIWAPIDIQLQLECFPHLRTYAIVPRIVEQENTILPL